MCGGGKVSPAVAVGWRWVVMARLVALGIFLYIPLTTRLPSSRQEHVVGLVSTVWVFLLGWFLAPMVVGRRGSG